MDMLRILLSVAMSITLAEAADITLTRHHPCNLFAPAEQVSVQTSLRQFPAGSGDLVVVLRDAFGNEILRRSMPVTTTSGKPTTLELALGTPGRGWYALETQAVIAGSTGMGSASLGVTDLLQRSAAEARTQGMRFGIKWWGGVTDKTEAAQMMAALGMNWTRIMHNEGGEMGTLRLLSEFPINGVIKVERFPKELFDSERYGDLAAWEEKYGRGAWTLKTLPRKQPYQEWLRTELAKLPPEQQVFEIWNEPWDKLAAEDFATLCQWIVPVIRADRPHAIIGPNLAGSTDAFGYDAKVAKAGGMQGMDMVCLHPYGGSEDRAWLRGYIAWIAAQAGKPIDIYITEYGAHSTPEGPAKQSELEQAQRVVRQSLALYAEGVKVLLPHWVGQSERNRTYHEDWFGFIRRNQEPKPVLIAHATSARMIDGSRYVGDLWYGPGVDAMLFIQGNQEVLALSTHGETKEINMQPGVATVLRHDLFGTETTLSTVDGKLHLSVGPAVIYLSGTALANLASRELRSDRWPVAEKPPRTTRTIHHFTTAPVIDGDLAEWKGATQLAMQNPKVAGDDASGTASLGWDAQYLYLAVAMRDNELLNTRTRAKLYQQDSIEVFIASKPRESGGGYGPGDSQLIIAPTSADGKPVVGIYTDRNAGTSTDISGAVFRFVKTSVGWTGEIAIPWAALPEAAPAVGASMALELRVNDADSSHERWKIDPLDGNVRVEDPSAWSLLLLAP